MYITDKGHVYSTSVKRNVCIEISARETEYAMKFEGNGKI